MDTSPADGSFPVAYQAFTGLTNLDLRGKGLLTIRPAEPRYVFTGERRAVFGSATTLTFSSDQIANVVIAGNRVEFSTRLGVSGKKGRPFVFYCATPELAADIAPRLPATQEADFVTSRDFQQRLKTLSSATSPWTSATNLIIAANVVVFVIMGCLGAGWIEAADMKPYVLYVANNGGATTDGEWWRLVTCMFVHYGVIHLLLNMWALFQTGHFVERLFGRSLFTLGYFGSGVIASFTSLYWHGNKIWSAGASGAVFGVYGLLLGFMLRERQSIPPPVLRPLFKSTITFAGYNLFYGLIHPRIDNAAHLGGLLGGLALGWLIALPVDPGIRLKSSAGRLRLGFAVLAVTTTAAIAFAPRYDYSFRDELHWADATEQPTASETDLLKQQEKQISALGSGGNPGELLAFIERTAVPFYENWRGQIAALKLKAGKITAQRRTKTLTFMDAKLANYGQLVAELHRNDPAALPHYYDREKQALTAAQSPIR